MDFFGTQCDFSQDPSALLLHYFKSDYSNRFKSNCSLKLIIRRFLAFFAAEIISRPSAAFMAMGFSHKTWQPALNAAKVRGL